MLKKYLIVFFVSMLPIIELRGAIPYAVGFKLPLIVSFMIAIIGNMIPVPFIYLFSRKVLEWGSNKKGLKKLFKMLLNKGERAGKKLQKGNSKSIYIALLLFVGIPLPGTGAWTGAIAASILDLDFKKSLLAIFGGIILAGIIMAIFSFGLFNIVIN